MHTNNAGQTVLVLDDDDLVRRMLADLLRQHGYTVHEAVDAHEAIDMLKSGEFSTAIVDKNLSGDLSGLDVLRRAGEISDLIRVIICTGYASKDSAIEALQHGAFDYVEKPFDNALMVEKVIRASESYLLARDHQQLFKDYEALFETIPGIVWFLTEDGRLKRISQEGAAMLGYSPTELLGKPYDVLIPADTSDDDVGWAFKERRTAARATRRQVVKLRTRTGENKLIEISSRGAYDRASNGGEKKFLGTLGVGWDITERMQLEEQLQQARKLEAIGRLAGGIAHDFNNLLTVILNNAQFLTAALRENEGLLPDAHEIERAAHRAADLTQQLLAFSRKQVIHQQALRLDDVLANIRRLLERLISEDVVLDITSDPDLYQIKADPTQMEQLIVNLAANARDAMPEGGTLTVQTSNVELDEEFCKAHIDIEPGAYVSLSVSDTGVGMNAEVRSRIFEPFYTTKEPGRGTGLGMATVHGIVGQSGGQIVVNSEENVGTTVQVYLPAVDAPEAVQQTSSPMVNLQPGQETVLVIEDESMVRQLAKRILERSGYHVLVAENGVDGMAKLEQAAQIDVLLTDMVMPKMGGQEVAQRMRQRIPELRVVYMSGYVGNIASEKDMVPGSAFVQKPFTAPRLLTVVRDLLDGPPSTH